MMKFNFVNQSQGGEMTVKDDEITGAQQDSEKKKSNSPLATFQRKISQNQFSKI